MRIFVPDGLALDLALSRTTSLGIGAHPDDLEIMASSPIVESYRNAKKWFCAVVVTDGSGSPRSGKFKRISNEQMRMIRREEQKRAAALGKYGAVVFLAHASVDVKKQNRVLMDELTTILNITSPDVVYTHNLADKHPTHVAVAVRVLEAIRTLPPKKRPTKVLGCEVWRSLDWLTEKDRVVLNDSKNEELQRSLLRVFRSQIAGGKWYDLAALGRRHANATFRDAHGVDQARGETFAMDLTPLVKNPKMAIRAFVKDKIDRFEKEVNLLFMNLD